MSTEFEELFFNNLSENRGNIVAGGNPFNFVELFGGLMIEMSYYEPDPNTLRSNYYYNTRMNRLFYKIKTGEVYTWKQISSYFTGIPIDGGVKFITPYNRVPNSQT